MSASKHIRSTCAHSYAHARPKPLDWPSISSMHLSAHRSPHTLPTHPTGCRPAAIP